MRSLILIILSFFPISTVAQCPFQITDCKGKCPRFTDLNNDTYCDFTAITQKSVPDSVIKDTLQIFASSEKSEMIKKDSNIQNKKNSVASITRSADYSSLKRKSKEINSQNPQLNQDPRILQKPYKITSAKQSNYPAAVTLYKRYSLLLISSLCVCLYIFSFMLAKFKVIEIRIHRKIWNILLTATFLVTGVLGLFMVLQINYSIQIKWFKPLLIWHVSFGIGMAIISVFHFLWHWSYFKKIFNFIPFKSSK